MSNKLIQFPESLHSTKTLLFAAIGLTIILGLVPLGLYAAVLGSVPAIHAAAALEMIEQKGDQVALVDVRQEVYYQERYIAG